MHMQQHTCGNHVLDLHECHTWQHAPLEIKRNTTDGNKLKAPLTSACQNSSDTTIKYERTCKHCFCHCNPVAGWLQCSVLCLSINAHASVANNNVTSVCLPCCYTRYCHVADPLLQFQLQQLLRCSCSNCPGCRAAWRIGGNWSAGRCLQSKGVQGSSDSVLGQ